MRQSVGIMTLKPSPTALLAVDVAGSYQRRIKSESDVDERHVLELPDIMFVDDSNASVIESEDVESGDIMLRDIMRKAKSRTDRALLRRKRLQAACMWETICTLVLFVDGASVAQRRRHALRKLSVLLAPCVARWLRVRLLAKRRTLPDDKIPERPSIDHLKGHTILGLLTQAMLQQCRERLTPKAFGERETIVRQGKPVRSLFIIAAGRCATVDVGHTTAVGNTLTVGAIFGDLDEDGPSPVSVVADAPSILWVLERAEFDSILADSSSGVAAAATEAIALSAIRTCFPFSRIARAGECDVLSQLPAQSVDEIAKRADPLVLRRDDTLFTEGDTAKLRPWAYICLSGTIELRRSLLLIAPGAVQTSNDTERITCGQDTHGQEHPHLGRFPVVGHMPHIMPVDYDATCVAATDAKLWRIPAPVLVHALLSNPSLIVKMRKDVTEVRLQRTPRPNRFIFSKWAVFAHSPPHRLDRLGLRATISTLAPNAVLVSHKSLLKEVFVVVSGTVLCRRPNPPKGFPALERFQCDPHVGDSWVRVGGDWEALGLGTEWREEWTSESIVDYWVISLQDIRSEFHALTVEHQQKALHAARRDLMAEMGLSSVPKVQPRPLDVKPVVVTDHNLAIPTTRQLRHLSSVSDLQSAADTDAFAASRRSSSVALTHRTDSQRQLPRGVPSQQRDGEREFQKAVRDADLTYVPVAPVSERAQEVLSLLDEWNITAESAVSPPVTPKHLTPRPPPKTVESPSHLRGMTVKQLFALVEGRDPVLADAVVDDVAPRLAFEPPLAVLPPRRPRWPSAPARRSQLPRPRCAELDETAPASRRPTTARAGASTTQVRSKHVTGEPRLFADGLLFQARRELLNLQRHCKPSGGPPPPIFPRL